MFSRQQKARRHIGMNTNHIPLPFHRMYAEQFSCLSALHSGMKSAISSVHSLTDSVGILWAPARKVLVNQRDTALGLATPLDGSQFSLWCPLMAATGFYKFITSHTFAWFLAEKKIVSPYISLTGECRATKPIGASTSVLFHPPQPVTPGCQDNISLQLPSLSPSILGGICQSLLTLWRRRIQWGAEETRSTV